VVPPAGFFKQLRELCDENDMLLIADEVQSGFGRTGKFFAIEHFGVEPDIIIMAKGIAGGLPLAAIGAPDSLMSRALVGSMGGTYGGNAVAAAAANAVIDTFKSENILSNVQQRSKQFFNGLHGLAKRYPIADVRGLGLMIAIEFSEKGCISAVQKACLDNGLLVLSAGMYDTLRFIPPLNVTEQEIDQALGMLDKAFQTVFKKK